MKCSTGSQPRRHLRGRGTGHALAVAFGTTMLLASGPAPATRIPGMGDIPNGFYFTKKMDPIRVTLRHTAGGEMISEPLATFEIPRAYIFLSSLHSEKDFPDLPPEIVTDSIFIAMTYPDGIPYSLALDDRREGARADLEREKASYKGHAHRFRFVLMESQISGSVPNAYDSPTFRPYKYEHYIDDYRDAHGTLKHYSTIGVSGVYLGEPGDLIRRVRCPRDIEHTNPVFFCQYHTVLSSHVVAKVTFVDFRVNGGLEFAEERIRAFKAAVCRYIDCD